MLCEQVVAAASYEVRPLHIRERLLYAAAKVPFAINEALVRGHCVRVRQVPGTLVVINDVFSSTPCTLHILLLRYLGKGRGRWVHLIGRHVSLFRRRNRPS